MTGIVCFCIVMTLIILFILRVLVDISNHLWEVRTENMKSRMELEMVAFYLKLIEKKLNKNEE